MPWLQLKLHARPEQAETIAERLSDAGATAVTFQDAKDQPLYEPQPGNTPLWEQIRITALFPADTNMETLKQRLQQADTPLEGWHVQPLAEQAWELVCMDGVKPMRFGEKLWICPGWHSPPDAKAVNILLDPGLAFGTGTHPTTALCLQWLDAHPPAGLDVIDYGCGSGILAIAAARLGARQVQAIDNDPQALQSTRSNAKKNRLEDKITTQLPDERHPARCELLLANILANPLIELAPHFSGLLLPGSPLVLSGILAEQADSVARAYQPWFTLTGMQEQNGWLRMEGCRKRSAGT